MPKSKPGSGPAPEAIAGYIVLPITLPSTASLPPATHYLYLRRHQPKLPTPDDERSLFCVNCPVDATDGHFRGLFTSIGGGRVESVWFEGDPMALAAALPQVVPAAAMAVANNRKGGGEKGRKRKRGAEGEDVVMDPAERGLPKVWDREVHKSGGTAVVVFVDKASLEMTVKAVQRVISKKKVVGKNGKQGVSGGGVVVWGEKAAGDVPKLGISRYLTHHALTFPAQSALQSSVDAYMTHFTYLETLRAQALSRMRNQIDDDGFTMVVRGGRSAPAKQEEAQAMLEKKKKEEEEKMKGNVGFYRFQTREGKKEEARRLIERFESDRRRVEERKGKRKFRPL